MGIAFTCDMDIDIRMRPARQALARAASCMVILISVIEDLVFSDLPCKAPYRCKSCDSESQDLKE